MKIAGALIVILALVIGIVPQLTDCHSQGKLLTLADGRTVDMKCHWTAMAEVALAVPLLAVGGLMAFGRRKENRRSLGIMGTVLGVSAILVPTVLIGVCANNTMLCKSIMQPTLILAGTVAAVASLAILVVPMRASRAVRMSLLRLAWRNIAGSSFRSWVVFLCALFVAGLALSSTLVMRGAENSLRLAMERLGADIIVVPRGAETKVESALLMGHPATVWMPRGEPAEDRGSTRGSCGHAAALPLHAEGCFVLFGIRDVPGGL